MENKVENKKIKIVIIVLAIVVLTIAGIFIYKLLSNDKSTKEGNKEVVSKITPILYEVTKEGSANKMYLFGSIHIADKDDLVFPEYVLKAYNDSQYLACEYNIIEANKDVEKTQELVMKMLYQDGTTIKEHMEEANYNKLVDFLTKKNAYVNVYKYYRPVFFYSLMSNLLGKDAKLYAESGVDEYFLSKATNDKKTILEVETFESQMDLLFSFSDKFYEAVIKNAIDDYDKSVKELEELYNNWKQGNEKEILELNDEDITIKDDYSEELKKEVIDFNQKLIGDRNKTMTDKVIEYFNNNQDVFFMVGTLHIIGDDGIANHLSQQGFNVKRVQ